MAAMGKLRQRAETVRGRLLRAELVGSAEYIVRDDIQPMCPNLPSMWSS